MNKIFKEALEDFKELKEVLANQKIKYAGIVNFNLDTIEEALTDKQDLERFTKLVIVKSFNFDRFRYALRYWNTIEEQLDVYNSGIGSVYKYNKEDFTFIKEMIAKYGKRN